MRNPVVQLSCETKQTGGLSIRYENCNTNYTVSSSIKATPHKDEAVEKFTKKW